MLCTSLLRSLTAVQEKVLFSWTDSTHQSQPSIQTREEQLTCSFTIKNSTTWTSVSCHGLTISPKRVWYGWENLRPFISPVQLSLLSSVFKSTGVLTSTILVAIVTTKNSIGFWESSEEPCYFFTLFFGFLVTTSTGQDIKRITLVISWCSTMQEMTIGCLKIRSLLLMSQVGTISAILSSTVYRVRPVLLVN